MHFWSTFRCLLRLSKLRSVFVWEWFRNGILSKKWYRFSLLFCFFCFCTHFFQLRFRLNQQLYSFLCHRPELDQRFRRALLKGDFSCWLWNAIFLLQSYRKLVSHWTYWLILLVTFYWNQIQLSSIFLRCDL